ncbi:MAG: HAMP domain-containing histidine kinase [Candidatus Azobacteroides sp.]|nr:HAMP domain-containing histidine kinase [Candidatus Azobacteroides sp.]
MASIYDTRQKVKFVFIFIALLIACIFLYISNQLVKDLSAEEKNKIEIWAEATRLLASDDPDVDLALSLHVIQSNTTIPVLLLDDKDNVIMFKNIDGVQENEDIDYRLIRKLKKRDKVIPIIINEQNIQYLYYDDSVLLKRLAVFPALELLVMGVFFLISVLALASTKKAEQNQVWVGLSKETAHQLGTPISSLMAWETLLKDRYPEDKLLEEMGKDVLRLRTIAERFSKVGSKPELEITCLQDVICKTVDYMSKRISGKIVISTQLPEEPVYVKMSEPLFEWVMENLFKNAVDAMPDGKGRISVELITIANRAITYITDTGKGISKNKFKTIFNPGYTTKKRGWGLGLSLVKRIVEDYHEGKIYVCQSEINKGTTFCLELKKWNIDHGKI